MQNLTEICLLLSTYTIGPQNINNQCKTYLFEIFTGSQYIEARKPAKISPSDSEFKKNLHLQFFFQPEGQNSKCLFFMRIIIYQHQLRVYGSDHVQVN